MAFSASVVGSSPGSLIAGQRYYIQVLLKQGDDYDTFVNVAARRQGDSTPVQNLQPLNPYGHSKLMVETLLADSSKVSSPRRRASSLA